MATSLARDALLQANSGHEENERARRKAKEALERNEGETDAARLASDLARAQLESEVSRELVKLREMALANEKLAGEIHELRARFLREKVQWVADKVAFSEADLLERLLDFNNLDVALNEELKSAQANLDYAQQQWSHARQTLDSAPAEDAALAEEVEAWRIARQCVQQKVAVLNHRLQLAEDMRTMWRRRFRVFQGAAKHEWEAEANGSLEQLDREQRICGIRNNQLRQDLAALDKRLLEAEEMPDEVKRWVRDERNWLQELAQGYDRYLADIESSRRLHRRFLDQIGSDADGESTGSWLAGLWHGVASVWNYELTAVDDRPIRVGTVVSSIILLFIGVILSRLLSRTLGQRVLLGEQRRQLDAGKQ